MSTERSYPWSTFCAWGLTGSVAVLGVAGAVAMFEPAANLDGVCVAAFAAMAAFAIAGANNAAAAAMHALSAGGSWRTWHWPTLAPAIVCAVGFAVASNIGVHLGWAILAANAAQPQHLPPPWQIDVAALFLCFAKPAMTWVIEGRRTMDREAKAAADKAQADELAAIRAANQAKNPPARQPFQPEVVEGGRTSASAGQRVALAAAAAAAVIAPPAAQAVDLAAPAVQSTDQAPIGGVWPSREAHARALLRDRQKERAVARETGLTRYKVSLLAAELGLKTA